MVRQYVQSKRAQAAEATRRRLVEAVSALHEEQGIAATSLKQIAERAGVGIGTVYHHFPTYDDAIAACGAHMLASFPPPDESLFEGLANPAERVAALCSAFYSYYETNPSIELVRADQNVSPVLRDFLAEEEKSRTRLAAAALGGAPEELRRLLAALLDIGVWRALTRSGFSTSEAAGIAAGIASSHGSSRQD